MHSQGDCTLLSRAGRHRRDCAKVLASFLTEWSDLAASVPNAVLNRSHAGVQLMISASWRRSRVCSPLRLSASCADLSNELLAERPQDDDIVVNIIQLTFILRSCFPAHATVSPVRNSGSSTSIESLQQCHPRWSTNHSHVRAFQICFAESFAVPNKVDPHQVMRYSMVYVGRTLLCLG
jgi:hypothetical protein